MHLQVRDDESRQVRRAAERRNGFVCLHGHCREQHGAGNVALLHAGYGQRTQKRERRAFEEIAAFYGVSEKLIVQLDHFRPSAVPL